MKIQIHRYLNRTKMAGPGWRFCIWVQGCSRRCENCMAKETWLHNDGSAMDTEELLKQIVAVPDIEGVTFLGGEPFEQPRAVALLAQGVKNSGLSVVTFTGFTIEELSSQSNPYVQYLLKVTDLLIDGPFIEDKFSLNRPWVGSSNQRFQFLTERYNENDLIGVRNQVEIRITPNGKTLINGMCDFSKIKGLL